MITGLWAQVLFPGGRGYHWSLVPGPFLGGGGGGGHPVLVLAGGGEGVSLS